MNRFSSKTSNTRQQNPAQGVAFDFLDSEDAPPDQPAMTGHASGLITINIDSLNLSMGQQDLPLVMPQPAIDKMA